MMERSSILFLIFNVEIALSYFGIPALIIYARKRRPDLISKSITIIFVILLLLRGVTHVAVLLALFGIGISYLLPLYGVTGQASLIVTLLLVAWRKRILTVPSLEELKASVQRQRTILGQQTLLKARLEREIATAEMYRAAHNAAVNAILIADMDGTIRAWNRAATETLGYEEREAVGRNLKLIMPQRYREAHDAGLARIREGSPLTLTQELSLEALHKNGTEVLICLRLAEWQIGDLRFVSGTFSRRKDGVPSRGGIQP